MKYLIPIIAFFISGVCLAQKPTEKTLLWKISGKGIHSASYLYGTHHLVCQDQLKIDSAIKKAFRSTQQLYLELDMDDPTMALEALKYMPMKNKQSLSDFLSPKDYDSVATLFQKRTGIPMLLFKSSKPILLASMLYPAMMQCKPEGWETVFMMMAKELNMPVNGLETIAFQMSIFDSIPYKAQAESLKEMLYNFDSLQRTNTKLVNMYQNKDLDKLQQEVVEDKDLGKYAPVLLYNRNANWVPKIAAQAKQQPTFFAVGAGHLGGNKGVIALLRKQGYTVTPVMY
ncbi:hypothetical protein HNQ91_003081 [Filimonas zeae]|uniref:Lipoprotein n=1 Tax=Filimonas zeae TaxID=1737353 RepID=A0A917IY97_9BACT|nr:TraB/GumN family protein [Filimonas zeae]MDR6340016.1 hypothetical protein [Filimonas zeae]GGH70744.1 lipoprotein [Filimonas zeae]